MFDYLESSSIIKIGKKNVPSETSTMSKESSRHTCLTAQERFKREWALIFCIFLPGCSYGRSSSVKTGGLTGITKALSHCTWHCSGVGILTTWLVI